jgi:hypothetical protein
MRRYADRTPEKVCDAGCPKCGGRMFIAASGLVCENGCGKLQPFGREELERLRRRRRHSVIHGTPVSQMTLYSY